MLRGSLTRPALVGNARCASPLERASLSYSPPLGMEDHPEELPFIARTPVAVAEAAIRKCLLQNVHHSTRLHPCFPPTPTLAHLPLVSLSSPHPPTQSSPSLSQGCQGPIRIVSEIRPSTRAARVHPPHSITRRFVRQPPSACQAPPLHTPPCQTRTPRQGRQPEKYISIDLERMKLPVALLSFIVSWAPAASAHRHTSIRPRSDEGSAARSPRLCEGACE
jgi:hypothetical protein